MTSTALLNLIRCEPLRLCKVWNEVDQAEATPARHSSMNPNKLFAVHDMIVAMELDYGYEEEEEERRKGGGEGIRNTIQGRGTMYRYRQGLGVELTAHDPICSRK